MAMEAFRILKPGLLTTVQDLGRYGFLRYGVPISGAMDNFSLVAANALVGNDLNSASLEMTLVGPELQASAKTQIAVTGGTIAPLVNGESVPMWQTLMLQKGDLASFGRMETGCRSYLAVRGGVNVPIVLGSRSTYARGGFGGTSGRPLRAGDVVEGFDVPLLEVPFSMPERLIPKFQTPVRVSVILGPQADMFTEKGTETFLSSCYNVSLESDRMGYRLEGPAVEHKAGADIVSDALLPGAVQVPRSGQPIVMMKDAQTTGGYAKIAVVASFDLDLLGQAKPNDTIEFLRIDAPRAYQRLREYHERLDISRSVLINRAIGS